ncbi:MAG: AzlD domain-containing protein [Oscillospiraceae bacterium]|nr:AzlD domain-containing protein [Oscillospiraceae bacterium]
MEYWIYLAIMAGSTYLIRSVPFALMRKRITNPFVRSFLYYIPYAVLTAMTFPAVLFAARNVVAAAVGFGVAILFALWGKGLTTVAAVACAGVFIVDWIMSLI